MAAERGGSRYWHGGQRGLSVGEYLLPPEESGYRHGSGEYMDAYERRSSGYRFDRVYLTTIRAAAVMYAALHPSGGCVYEVQPEGELEPDPDCIEPGLSMAVQRARIIALHHLTKSERRKVNRAFGLPVNFRPRKRGTHV